jgi:hypothetical protein
MVKSYSSNIETEPLLRVPGLGRDARRLPYFDIPLFYNYHPRCCRVEDVEVASFTKSLVVIAL